MQIAVMCPERTQWSENAIGSTERSEGEVGGERYI